MINNHQQIKSYKKCHYVFFLLFISISFIFVQTKSVHAQVGAITCNSGAIFDKIGGYVSNSSIGKSLGLGGKKGGGGGEVPTADSQTRSNTTASKNVQCTWNGVAWQLARIALHQLTGNVINWVNTGFKGSPSFLTNPTGFFANVADQTTGYFIQGEGPLSKLCSPFNVDVRLAIALGQSGMYRNDYTCTLSTIINNAGNTTVNGRSIAGFMNGDFSQGGWQGFIAVGDPGNNPGRVYLQAKSDLNERITNKQGQYQQELLQGSGFLSATMCKNISEVDAQAAGFDISSAGVSNGTNPGASDANTNSSNYADTGYGGTTNIQRTIDPATGNVTYQSCDTETPGSIISSAVNKQLGAPTDELNLTHDINEVVSAVFSQLLTKTLSGGLLSSSRPSYSNGNQSIVNQLINDDRQNQSNSNYLQAQIADQIMTNSATAQQAIGYRAQILSSLTNELGLYQTTMSCIGTELAAATQSRGNYSVYSQPSQLSVNYLQNQLNSINAAIININKLVSSAEMDLYTASSTIAAYQDAANQIQNAPSLEAANALNNQLSAQLSATPYDSASDPVVAESDLKGVTENIKTLENARNPYQLVCNGQQVP